MNSDQYLKVIDSRVIPQLMDWYGSLKECVLQQDKAPCHSSKAVKQNLNDAGIKVLEWPGNSPDMNPTENVWAVLKRKIRENLSTTKKELKRKVLDLWYKDEYIHTMSRLCSINGNPHSRSVMQKEDIQSTNCLLYLLHVHLLYVIIDPGKLFQCKYYFSSASNNWPALYIYHKFTVHILNHIVPTSWHDDEEGETSEIYFK